MTQAQGNTNETKSLQQLADEERRDRPGQRISMGMPGLGDKYKDMTAEERAAEDQRQRQRSDVAFTLQQFFGNIAKQAVVFPMRLIALPEKLANDYVLGSNVGLRIVLDPEGVTQPSLIEDLKTQLLQYNSDFLVPGLAETTVKLGYRDYLGMKTTLAEVYWLFELCSWLQCLTPMFSNVLSETTKDKKVADEDFSRKLELSGADSMLCEAMRQQYATLERLLHRLV